MRPELKVWRDLSAMRGRIAFMVLGLAAGLTSMGSVLTMRTVLSREMRRSYRESRPASATLETGGQIDDRTLAQLRQREEITLAERRATREARWRRPGAERWGRGLLFVVEDFEAQRIARIRREEGARVPPPGTVLVERSAMAVLGLSLGDEVELSTAAGRPRTLRISGVVHESALAPAVTEQAGYFYATPETLAQLEGRAVLDEVRVVVADEPLDRSDIVRTRVEAQVDSAAAWLGERGVVIHEIKVPDPGAHPHEGPSRTVLLLFAIFSGLTVFLASILVASLLSTILARQVREVAVLKTLGASRARIAWMYALMMSIIAALALVVSVLPTVGLARLGIEKVSTMLNLDVASYGVPFWVVALQVGVGFSLPLLTAAPAIARASRRSVQEALRERGVSAPRKGWLSRVSARISIGDRVARAALRNAFRMPRRLFLTVGLLAVGGGLFVAAASVADAWEAMTEQVFETRHYDVELRLAQPADDRVLDTLRHPGADGGVETVERWGFAPVTFASETGLPLSRTYPDGGHGSFGLVAAPASTELVDFDLRRGRWLRPSDRDQVVLNQLAAARFGEDPIGHQVELIVEGERTRWQVVGVVDEVAAPATAYVSSAGFVERTGLPLNGVRLATGHRSEPGAVEAIIDQLDARLAEDDVRVAAVVPLELLYNAMGEHVSVLIACLTFLALLMAIVSALSLGSSVSTSVVERTRELGVLGAIGARPAQVRRMILIEALFVAVVSLPVALLVAVPLASGIGYLVGMLSFRLPLGLDLSGSAMAMWTLGSVALAALASWVPARRATRRTVRDALAQI